MSDRFARLGTFQARWLVAAGVCCGCGPGQVTDGSSTSDTDTSDTDGSAQACALVRVESDAYVQTGASSLGNPHLWTLDPGAPGVPAQVLMIQDEDLELTARRVELQSPWPGVQVGPPLPLEPASWMSRLAPLGEGSFAYIYDAYPENAVSFGTYFATIDTDAWSVSDEVLVLSNTNNDFVDLMSVPSGELLVATYTTDPEYYAPDYDWSGVSIGTLDVEGSVLGGPSELLARAPPYGSTARSFWAGDRLGFAIGHDECYLVSPLCFPHSVVLAQPSAPDENGVAIDGFEASHVFAGLPDTQYVARPYVLDGALGYHWLIWFEGDDWGGGDDHLRVRGIVLDENGDPLPWPPDDPTDEPITFLEVAVFSWPIVAVSSLGITVSFWLEEPCCSWGHKYVVHHFGFDFEPLGEPIVLDIGQYAFIRSIIALDHPRSLLLGWTEDDDGVDEPSIRLTRLECE